jgi:hypothetical protein
MSADAEHLFILRLPEPEVSRVKEATRRDELGEMLQLEFKSEPRGIADFLLVCIK